MPGRKQNMDEGAKKRKRDGADVVSLHGDATTKIEQVNRAQPIGQGTAARPDSLVASAVAKKRRRRRKKCSGAKELGQQGGSHDSMENAKLVDVGGSGELASANGSNGINLGLASDVAWMGERVWQYVQRRLPSVLVARPPLLETSEDEELMSYGAPNPALFRQAIEWKPVLKTVETEVTVCGRRIAVTLTRESAVVDAWVERQSGALFGMDAEWRPRFSKGSPDSKVALLQISAETECLIVQMLFLDGMPAQLVRFLENPERKLAGVGIHGDSGRLKRDYGLICKGEVELTSLAAAAFRNDELMGMGLKKLAKKVINVDMEKPKRVTMSNWAKQVLDQAQVQYACTDAWISFAVFHTLSLLQQRATHQEPV